MAGLRAGAPSPQGQRQGEEGGERPPFFIFWAADLSSLCTVRSDRCMASAVWRTVFP